MLYNKLLLITYAFIGSAAGYYLINYLLFEINIKQYIIIEIIISLFHYLFNRAKKEIFSKYG